MMTINKYYTFKDIVDFIADNYPVADVVYPVYPNQADISLDWFTKTLDNSNINMRIVGFKASSTIIPASTIKQYVNEVINIVYNRHSDDYIAHLVKLPFDPNDFDDDKAMEIAFTKLINLINNTAPKYIPLMYQYVQNYEDPIKMLESISESFNRFNDTPQNAMDNVDFNTEPYATNMGKSKNVSKVDSASILDRLKDLQEKFRSIILDWSNEFNQEFITDLQLED